ncbi:hypothetical protein BGZ47_006198 [Haplosporangium gracile]|nr:hypothetical protein BGZ47_006198 [Haplosporangium gracile]
MDASHAFAAQLLDTLPEPEITEIQRRQAHMSVSLQKASSSLSALNEFSAVKWADLHPKFETHTKLIKELQSDLNHVFRKIRTIKAKLNLPNMDDGNEDEDNSDEGGARVGTTEEQASASLPSSHDALAS